MKVSNEPLITIPIDLSASTTLVPIYLGNIYTYSIQLIFTGTPTGTFKLQCSNDEGHPKAPEKPYQYATVVNWVDITGGSQMIASDGIHTYNVETTGYLWVRVAWIAIPGSVGILTDARITIKGT